MWATVDVYSSSQWINSLPSGEARDSAVQGLVRALTISAPEDAWTWALSVQASGNRLSALQVAYTGLTKRDPARAQQFLQSADLSSDEIAAVQQPPQR